MDILIQPISNMMRTSISYVWLCTHVCLSNCFDNYQQILIRNAFADDTKETTSSNCIIRTTNTQISENKGIKRVNVNVNPIQNKIINDTDTNIALFTRKANLTPHYLNVHEKIKPYQCKLCNQAFTQSHNLKNHLLIHLGEKPYQCSFCDKRFRVKYNLRIHERQHS